MRLPLHFDRLLLLSLLCLFFSVLMLLWFIPNQVENFDAGEGDLSPRFFPYLMTFVLVGLSGVISIRTIFGKMNNMVPTVATGRRRWILLSIVLFYCYWGLMSLFGMLPSSIIVLAAFMRLFAIQQWLKIVVFSLLFNIIVFLFFEKVAHIPMPRGMLSGY